jgi:hypothetical protein
VGETFTKRGEFPRPDCQKSKRPCGLGPPSARPHQKPFGASPAWLLAGNSNYLCAREFPLRLVVLENSGGFRAALYSDPAFARRRPRPRLYQ